MTTLLHFNMQDGDWVRGKTNKDELFQGYIESINLKKGSVKIRVTQSDNRQIIGEISDSTPDRIRLLEEMPPDREGHLLNFIDLALSTKDKKWFMELTDALKQTRIMEKDGLAS
ncbi:IDEAL domain-containing protein [Kroppenstedtia eburnea]|uniref:IDEAL domain-containing protein n=1 Tax=Kroppenstedtia eburnea TaxID=714067 RepID=A0A1N7PLC3_9BACL|nr:IDEAL domain-containing protein [Kroppenstedtia eburnea]EGK11220.1 hypothetical protein HMPREF9374_2038 [Desmospora sp. 8437]QKI83251.1 IDEAL domain-containing protein [Kroppenstedtia eburnea]SIT11388.1 IDEAL domain-containing protein [Kroppenstedtia eburnea]